MREKVSINTLISVGCFEVSINLAGSNKKSDLIFIMKYFSVFQIRSPVIRRGNAYQGVINQSSSKACYNAFEEITGAHQ